MSLVFFVALALAGPLEEQLFAHRDAPSAAPAQGSISQPPSLLWKVKLPGPPANSASHSEWGRPVVSEHGVFVGGSSGRGLYLYGASTGNLKQTYEASDSVEAPASLSDEEIFFSDTSGNTYSYQVNGQLNWKHKGNAPILTAPTVTDDFIVITNVDDLAVCLDRKTGELIWQFRAPKDLTRVAELTLYAAPQAILQGELVLLGFSTGALVAVNLESGEQVWSKAIGEGRYPDLVAEPVLSGQDIFTSGYFKPLLAIDSKTQTVRWRVDAGSAQAVLIEERGGRKVVYHPGVDGNLRAYSALTGAVLWVWESGSNGALTTPVSTKAGLLVASSDGVLHLIEVDQGATVWSWHEGFLLRGISAPPAVAGRQVFFVSNAGVLYSMISNQTSTGPKEMWSRADRQRRHR